MTDTPQDGTLLISELADDVALRSNLLHGAITGRDAVAQMIETIDSLCPMQTLLYRHSTGNREFLLTDAALMTGEAVQITTVGVRDDQGWISSVMQDIRPPAMAAKLAAQLDDLHSRLEPAARSAKQ